RFDGAGALAERYEEPCDNGFIYEIRHFADLLRNGDLDSPWIPLRDTLDCARIFDEARAQF
nr:gfo/Idh/MocA family oxidoreductase [Clostridia bacterium]